jgi:hypothetical protein
MSDHGEGSGMSPAPLVSCSGCGFTWNSATMAEGLRLLGSCPRCDSELEFREVDPREDRFVVSERDLEPAFVAAETAPHLVLGIPRR